MAIKRMLIIFILLNTVFSQVGEVVENEGIALSGFPDSIVTSYQSINELGLQKITCKINSFYVKKLFKQYKDLYGNIPFVNYEESEEDYQLNITKDSLYYFLPKINIEYEKVAYLEPYYGVMDSAQLAIDWECNNDIECINSHYNNYKLLEDESDIFGIDLSLRDTVLTFFHENGRIQVDYKFNGNIFFKNLDGGSFFIEKISNIYLSDYYFRYKIYFLFGEDRVKTHYIFKKVEGIFVLSRIKKVVSYGNNSTENIYCDIEFYDYKMIKGPTQK